MTFSVREGPSTILFSFSWTEAEGRHVTKSHTAIYSFIFFFSSIRFEREKLQFEELSALSFKSRHCDQHQIWFGFVWVVFFSSLKVKTSSSHWKSRMHSQVCLKGSLHFFFFFFWNTGHSSFPQNRSIGPKLCPLKFITHWLFFNMNYKCQLMAKSRTVVPQRSIFSVHVP